MGAQTGRRGFRVSPLAGLFTLQKRRRIQSAATERKAPMPEDSGRLTHWDGTPFDRGAPARDFTKPPAASPCDEELPSTFIESVAAESAAPGGGQPSQQAAVADGAASGPASALSRAAPRLVARSLRRVRPYLASGVGRRLMLMFLAAGLVPIVLLASLSYVYLSRFAPALFEDALALQADQYAAAIDGRLKWAQSVLRRAAAAPKPAAELSPRAGLEFAGVSLLDRQGQPLHQEGQKPLLAGFDPRSLDPTDARRATALLSPATPASGLDVVLAVADHPKIAFIAAALSPRFLWDEASPEPSRPVRCVFTASGERLSCPYALSAGAWPALTTAAAAAPVTIEADGQRLRAWVRPLPGNDGFAGADLLAVALLPESALMQPEHRFYAAVVPASALALLAVALIGAIQVRRLLVPLRRLLRGMRRVARRDFFTPVQVHSHDEFGEMARAFNAMSAALGLHFRTLSALAEIDRTILTSVDMRQVADIALACIREIAATRVVSLGLLEPDSPGTTQIYLLGANGETARDALPQPLDLAQADASLRKWSASIRLPGAYRALLRDHGAQYLYLLPIARADRVWGVVALGHDEKTALSAEQALALAGVIDRLAVALSSLARDKQLHDQAHYDSLTGLPNRHYLMAMLAQQIRQARRESRMLAVLYIDLDRFKRVNDTLGHAAGDLLLRKAANRIRRSVRDGDIVARLGGDEFTVVLPSVKEAADAGSVARTLIAALNRPFQIAGSAMYAGGSVGIALFPKDGDRGAELLKKADTALYRAKDRGRSRYAFFEEQMNADASARVTIDRELREALRRSEFRLHYQPQIDLATGEVCAVEALLRWQHPQRGLMGPESFIDHAEDSGLIEPIGRWVLREACQQYQRWVEAGAVIPRVSVNVSAMQLRNPSFAAMVEGALASSTMSAHHLELEVTESLLVDAGPDAIAILERLREVGVEIAVDDFGTGYSSFAYVKQLPASVLKLDRAFIVDVIDNPQAAIIATAIMEMASALGKLVVAEGVETPQQVQFLRRNRCARAQGFVFCQPLPPEQIPDFVRQRQRGQETIGRNTQPGPSVPQKAALRAAWGRLREAADHASPARTAAS
jgi:diguanylate cyclase (GGDEF)-like protein